MNKRNYFTLCLCAFGALFFVFVHAQGMPGAIVITKNQIEEKINEYVLKKSGWLKDDLLIEYKTQVPDVDLISDEPSVSSARLTAKPLVSASFRRDGPRGEPDIQIETVSGAKFLGFTPVKVNILLGNLVYKSFVIYLDIDAKVSVYLTNRWIKRQEFLTKDNIILAKSTRSKIPGDTIFSEKDFLGMIAKVSLPEGKIITQSVISAPFYIKRQDLVEVILRAENLIITTKALALMDGKEGQVIKLRNLDSKREIYGRVIDKGVVEVVN